MHVVKKLGYIARLKLILDSLPFFLSLFIFSMPNVSINFISFLSNLRDLILHDHFGTKVVKQNS